jgi:hypothetical protein
MNIYVIKHMHNSLTCYKTNVDVWRKLCKYGLFWPLINDNENELLHIKKTNKWLNNANSCPYCWPQDVIMNQNL